MKGKDALPLNNGFPYRNVPVFRRRKLRFGYAANDGIDGRDLESALQQGLTLYRVEI